MALDATSESGSSFAGFGTNVRRGTPTTLDRRRFLQLSALGIAAGLADTGCSPRSNRPLDQPALLATLGPDRVRALGTHYRMQTPGENNAATLRSALTKPHLGRFGKDIDDIVEDDFVSGRTVMVDGWILSLTEARQAALFSLAHS